MEPSEDATDIKGYFIDNPQTPNHDPANGANAWHPVNCDNLVMGPPRDFFDHAWSGGWPIGVSGSYTWPIHPIWQVVGDNATNSLKGWTSQVMTLSADGTMTVEKLDNTATRRP